MSYFLTELWKSIKDFFSRPKKINHQDPVYVEPDIEKKGIDKNDDDKKSAGGGGGVTLDKFTYLIVPIFYGYFGLIANLLDGVKNEELLNFVCMLGQFSLVCYFFKAKKEDVQRFYLSSFLCSLLWSLYLRGNLDVWGIFLDKLLGVFLDNDTLGGVFLWFAFLFWLQLLFLLKKKGKFFMNTDYLLYACLLGYGLDSSQSLWGSYLILQVIQVFILQRLFRGGSGALKKGVGF